MRGTDLRFHHGRLEDGWDKAMEERNEWLAKEKAMKEPKDPKYERALAAAREKAKTAHRDFFPEQAAAEDRAMRRVSPETAAAAIKAATAKVKAAQPKATPPKDPHPAAARKVSVAADPPPPRRAPPSVGKSGHLRCPICEDLLPARELGEHMRAAHPDPEDMDDSAAWLVNNTERMQEVQGECCERVSVPSLSVFPSMVVRSC